MNESDLLTLRVDITGAKPLVMHNIRLADEREPVVQEIKKLTSKPPRQKTAADDLEVQRLKWHGGLYYEPIVGYYLPTIGFIRCFENAAKATRSGSKVQRALVANDPQTKLEFPDMHLTPDELWAKPEYVWRTMVSGQGVKGGGKVPNTRPIFKMNEANWTASPILVLDPTALDLSELQSIVQRAGYVEGIFDARKLGYGRFEAKIHVL